MLLGGGTKRANGSALNVPSKQHPPWACTLWRLGTYRLQQNQILQAIFLRVAIGGFMVGVLPEWGNTRVKRTVLCERFTYKGLWTDDATRKLLCQYFL